MTETNIPFQAEVSRLLDIVVHSLYSEKDVFVRELVSNASDACDKLRYEALTHPEWNHGDFQIKIIADKDKRRLTISDNGIGMGREELIQNLGTIAKSGTTDFIKKMGDGKKADVNLIGQFGVGFYAAFMVAEKVEVISRKAGADGAHSWQSDGKGAFMVAQADKKTVGTDVILTLKPDEGEFLDEKNLHAIISKYSDHISIPIIVGADDKPANRALALWTRNKNDITADQYKEFYHHIAHAFDDFALNIHWRAEGKIEYTGLLFVPGMKPFDLFDPKRRHGVKLYVKRVFITDEAEGLIPPYLRFLRGVIDSEDLPLNVSREMLQHNPMLAKMRQGITRRVLGDLQKFADDKDAFAKFWDNFGALIKEGIYEDADNRDALLSLLRVRTNMADGLQSLDDYVARMKDGQENIFYITGDNAEKLLQSPHLEGFKAKGIEVLLLTDTVDDFWPSHIGAYKGKVLKSVTRAGEDLAKIKSDKADDKKDETAHGDMGKLIALMKLELGEDVKDIRVSSRLTESAVCLVADDGDIDIHLERFLKQHNQIRTASKRILEINPTHPLIRMMAGQVDKASDDARVKDIVWILLDQARLMDGDQVSDPHRFSQRLMQVMEQMIKAA